MNQADAAELSEILRVPVWRRDRFIELLSGAGGTAQLQQLYPNTDARDNQPSLMVGGIFRKIIKRVREAKLLYQDNPPTVSPEDVPKEKIAWWDFVAAVDGREPYDVGVFLEKLARMEARSTVTGFWCSEKDRDQLLKIKKVGDDPAQQKAVAAEWEWFLNTVEDVWALVDQVDTSEDFRVATASVNAFGAGTVVVGRVGNE